MGLLVLAYPILSNNYFQLIQDFRKVNDELSHHTIPNTFNH